MATLSETKKVRLGEMLVTAGLASSAQIDDAVKLQTHTGKKLGETLTDMGVVTETQLSQVLSNQLAIPWVNLLHVEFSRDLLSLISSDTARKFGLIPVYVRRMRVGNTLFVATDDPMNESALHAVAQEASMPVRAMVASASHVLSAIGAYYGGQPFAEVPTVVERKTGPIAPVELPPEEIVEDKASSKSSQNMPAQNAADKQPSGEMPAAEGPAKSKRKNKKMTTLTLLDGSTVRLPMKNSDAEDEPGLATELTTRDLIAALIARSEGKDVSQVLPQNNLDQLMATMLQLLLKKGLIADWEFVAELNRRAVKSDS